MVILGLIISIGTNIYQGIKLRRYAYNYKQGIMKYYEDFNPTFPIDGLDKAEIDMMIDEIKKQECDVQDKRVLSVDMLDGNHVLIQTGIMKGGLWGGGRVFEFNKTNNEWKLNKKYGSWIS